MRDMGVSFIAASLKSTVSGWQNGFVRPSSSIWCDLSRANAHLAHYTYLPPSAWGTIAHFFRWVRKISGGEEHATLCKGSSAQRSSDFGGGRGCTGLATGAREHVRVDQHCRRYLEHGRQLESYRRRSPRHRRHGSV